VRLRRIINAAALLGRLSQQAWLAPHGYAAAGLAWAAGSRDQVLLDLPGTRPDLGTRTVIFCHYDPLGEFRQHVRLYVEAFRAEGFSVVLVSNSGRLAAADLAWAIGHAARVLIRRNIGYDFGAWRDALRRIGPFGAGTECLLLANDSVYGPFKPLGAMLARMDFATVDAWSPTESWQHAYHLQSYLLGFGPRALASAAFAAFWDEVRDVQSKWWVVRQYEVGLTQRLLDAGLRCAAVWPYDELVLDARRRLATFPPELDAGCDPFDAVAAAEALRLVQAAARRVAMNPTSDLWCVLVEAEFPFIKRELLRHNPTRVPGVAAWQSVLAATAPEALGPVLADLRRSLRGRAP
jgi:hypothetical protein